MRNPVMRHFKANRPAQNASQNQRQAFLLHTNNCQTSQNSRRQQRYHAKGTLGLLPIARNNTRVLGERLRQADQGSSTAVYVNQ